MELFSACETDNNKVLVIGLCNNHKTAKNKPVTLRILQDFNYFFNREKAAQLFHDRWLKVSNRWYHFEPGGDELSGTLSFCHSSISFIHLKDKAVS